MNAYKQSTSWRENDRSFDEDRETEDKDNLEAKGSATKFESGRVYLPSEASWLTDYVNELTGFPGCKYDDQVDSTSQALEFLGRFTYLTAGSRFFSPMHSGYEYS